MKVQDSILWGSEKILNTNCISIQRFQSKTLQAIT